MEKNKKKQEKTNIAIGKYYLMNVALNFIFVKTCNVERARPVSFCKGLFH